MTELTHKDFCKISIENNKKFIKDWKSSITYYEKQITDKRKLIERIEYEVKKLETELKYSK